MNHETSKFNREFATVKPSILARDGMRCSIAGDEVQHFGVMDVDHIVKRSLRGTNEVTNLITLCRGCHNNYEIMNPYRKVSLLRSILSEKYGYAYDDKYTPKVPEQPVDNL